jgi:lipid A disaccharide synthetase
MPSILLGRRIFVERLQHEADPVTLASDIESILESPSTQGDLHEVSGQLRDMLFRPDTAQIFASMLVS